MKTKIFVLSVPPELEVDGKFFNKACCLLPDFKICDFIHLPQKGLSAMTSYEGEISFVSSAKKISVRIDEIIADTAKPISVKEVLK